MRRKNQSFVQLETDPLAGARKKLGTGEYSWLLPFLSDHGMAVSRLINYGCQIGSETFALVIELDLQMAVGVDANVDNLQHGQAAVGEAATGDNAIIKHDAVIAFVGSDIVEGIGLRDSYFDMGYCKNILDKVVMHAVGSPIEDLRRAASEMARVIRPGGIVVIEGVVANKAGETLDLDPHFRKFRMEPLPVFDNDDEGAKRAYRKQDV